METAVNKQALTNQIANYMISNFNSRVGSSTKQAKAPNIDIVPPCNPLSFDWDTYIDRFTRAIAYITPPLPPLPHTVYKACHIHTSTQSRTVSGPDIDAIIRESAQANPHFYQHDMGTTEKGKDKKKPDLQLHTFEHEADVERYVRAHKFKSIFSSSSGERKVIISAGNLNAF